MTRAALAGFFGLVVAACGGGGSDEVCHPPSGPGPTIDLTGPMCTHLSSYHLLTDEKTQTADPALFPYDLNTPLFSDYATKRRWMYIPSGQAATWEDPDSFDLPVGSVLVKTFSFPHDLRDPSQGEDLVETRLLIHKTSDLDGWEAASYTYDGTYDAKIAIVGETVPVSWIDATGAMQSDDYSVPNENQCLICHGEHDAVLHPLGPKARHLNRVQPGGTDNQLTMLIAAGKLTGAPADMTTWPKTAPWDDTTQPVDQRARGYVDVNCSHCHNPEGLARTSGVDFSVTSPSTETLGICKRPTAAGPGSGGFDFDILPGMPSQSIVVFRMMSTEADIKMPQLGRNLVHTEGVQLISDWITSLTGACGT